MNKNSSVMREQADMIASLEERLNREQKGPDGRGGKGDKKRIRELESDVESLKVGCIPAMFTVHAANITRCSDPCRGRSLLHGHSHTHAPIMLFNNG